MRSHSSRNRSRPIRPRDSHELSYAALNFELAEWCSSELPCSAFSDTQDPPLMAFTIVFALVLWTAHFARLSRLLQLSYPDVWLHCAPDSGPSS